MTNLIDNLIITDINYTQRNLQDNFNNCMLSPLYAYFGSINMIAPTSEILNVLPILVGNTKLSIRLIDWFVTNYSKKNNVIYPLYDNQNNVIRYFNVYSDYKSQLDGYRKKMFDPFCRKRRIPFYYTNDKCLITTIGQLNFFKWALSNKVLEYINTNYNIINQDMIESSKNKTKLCTFSEETEDSPSDSTKQRHELSENAMNSIKCIKQKIIVTMN